MYIKNYQIVIPQIKELVSYCRDKGIPIFYTEAIRELSGIDLLLNIQNILPRSKEEITKQKDTNMC